MWDVSYASTTRDVRPIEQHVHSVLEMMPLTGLLMVIALHWQAFLGLLGLERASFTMALKPAPPSWTYVATVFTLTALFEILPYLEELVRGIRHKGSPQ
jgi:hypothetical protein